MATQEIHRPETLSRFGSMSTRWVNDAPLLEAAFWYACAGLPVFPVAPAGKAPLVPRGVYAATCDERLIRQWWHRWPSANIGVPTGRPSGCWVLDIDPRHGGLDSLERLLRDAQVSSSALSSTRVQRSGGGGLHLWYALRADGVQLTNTSGFAGYPGLDLKVAGGYVIVAPSIHKSSSRYRWANDTELAPFPDLLVERFRAHRQRELARLPLSSPASPSFRSSGLPPADCAADPDYWLRCALRHAAPGCRNNYGYFLACHLLDDVGLTPEQAQPYLISYAEQVPQVVEDLFSVEEALSCLRSAARRSAVCGVRG